MYDILKTDKIRNELNELPDKRPEVSMVDVKEVRTKLGYGFVICKLLVQKSSDNVEAVQLFHQIMKKINDYPLFSQNDA